MRRYFLGMAANYTSREVWRHTFAVGRRRDYDELAAYLEKKYGGEAILCKNGRSALALALKAYFEPGDGIIVNGFTCYAVYEAVKAAGMVPIFVDISQEDLNFNIKTLENLNIKTDSSRSCATDEERVGATEPRNDGRKGACRELSVFNIQVRGVIIQNSLGNPVDIGAVEKFAKKHQLKIIEDLAHCAGVRYADGRECGTVGAAAVFSFGKDKSIDTISGGAVILRDPCKHTITAPSLAPKISAHLRARFYPLFGLICRKLTVLHLGGALMRGLIKLHWVEKSADNYLDLKRKPSRFEAKLALEQLREFKKSGQPPLREFCFVNNRTEVLEKLAKAGYYFGGFWYEKPVSPERYYRRVKFPEKTCPNAVFVAEHILNIPKYYSKKDLSTANKIIKEHLINQGGGENE